MYNFALAIDVRHLYIAISINIILQNKFNLKKWLF